MEIENQKAKQIKEGLAIAKKVDALRETFASLQEQHQKFIEGMQEDLKARTETLDAEINSKTLEVQDLEERRLKALKPITEETNRNELLKDELMAKRETLSGDIQKIKDKETKTKEIYEKGKATLAKINSRERRLDEVYEKAEKNTKETEKIKEKAVQEKAKFDSYMEEKLKELLTREASIAEKERGLETTAQKLVDDRNILLEREIILKDREETLAREIKRQNG